MTRAGARGGSAERGASFDIRTLGAGDVATMRSMLELFGEVFADASEHAANRPDDPYLAQLLARDTFIAIAATLDGAVVGGAASYVLPKYEQARSEIYLYDLAVAHAHRRKGIATALIDALRAIAAARDAWVVFVQADHGDDPAIALYSKLGAREDVLHFDIAPAAGRGKR